MRPAPTATTADAVATVGLGFSYAARATLAGVDIRLPRGQTLALLGPSGCGKTTLLRLVAGLLAPSHGQIRFDGAVVADAGSGAFVPPERRRLGMVFQDYALWPHMTVAGNVGFPLEMRGVGRAERDGRIATALTRVGLAAFAERRVADMSGGQQQRVAIARAIVAEPALVLFDEPLSNLDRELRETMVGEIGQLVAQLGLTALYVTHDQAEAFSLADAVAVMRDGHIEQCASPEALVDKPASRAVADFLRLGAVAAVTRDDSSIRLAGTDIALPMPADAGAATHVLIPARAVRHGSMGDQLVLPATVQAATFRGDGWQTTAQIGPPSAGITLNFLANERRPVGATLDLGIDPRALRWFDA